MRRWWINPKVWPDRPARRPSQPLPVSIGYAALIRRAAGLGTRLRRSGWFGRLNAAYSPPGIGRTLGVRNFPERILVGLLLGCFPFQFIRRLGRHVRQQIDVGSLHLGVSR